MHFVERIATKIERFGEQFTLNGAACRGIFRTADLGTLRTYLNDIEMMGVVHPALLLVTKPDVVINAYDTVTRDGRDHTVHKTVLQHIGDTPVARIAIMS